MVLDKKKILELIPHRPPFLWIDSVAELEAGVRCVALKFVDPAEALFEGHFPGNAILPGVLIIEAAAQTAAVMLGRSPVQRSVQENEHAAAGSHLLGAVHRFKFLKPVRPGSELRIETVKVAQLESIASVEASVWVGDIQVAKGEFTVLAG